MRHMAFAEVNVLPSNGTIATVVLRDLDLIFKVNNFSCSAFATKGNCTGSGRLSQICLDSHDPRRGFALVLISGTKLWFPIWETR